MTPEIILGPPGTGKTTALLDILDEELSAGTPPERIGFVSYTKKAANEAAERACARFNLPRERFPWFRTLHSLCHRRLGIEKGQVMDYKRQKEFGAYARVTVTGKHSEDDTTFGLEKGDKVMNMVGIARAKCIHLRSQYDIKDDGISWNEVERIAGLLEKFKREFTLVDFSDMLANFVTRQLDMDLDVLLVDEVQDLSRLQHHVVRLAARKCRRVVYAGDDDQAIFEFSGADVNTFVNMEGTVRVLDKSYRVPRSVQKLASRIISPVHKRREKTWDSRDAEGILEKVAFIDSVDWSAPDTGGVSPPILVLARNGFVLNSQVVPALKRRGIFFERFGHPSISQSLVNDILSWERLREGGRASVAECKSIYDRIKSRTGIAYGFKERLSELDRHQELTLDDLKKKYGLLTDAIWHIAMDRVPRDDVEYIILARQKGEKLKSRPRVRLSTIHSAKGGEADHVVLCKEVSKKTAWDAIKNPDPERRCWYVGVTRAKERLTIVESKGPEACMWV